jgi:hypothetical protein
MAYFVSAAALFGLAFLVAWICGWNDPSVRRLLFGVICAGILWTSVMVVAILMVKVIFLLLPS